MQDESACGRGVCCNVGQEAVNYCLEREPRSCNCMHSVAMIPLSVLQDMPFLAELEPLPITG